MARRRKIEEDLKPEFLGVQQEPEPITQASDEEDESDVKRPQLQGARKHLFEHPGTDNQSRIIHDEK